MKKWAYYNEIDPKAAVWIRELIKQGHIMDGIVDERSIIDVRADDVKGFIRCHWFAGIAVWDYALNQAGWDKNQEIWTGSCPCQPFSTAGKGKAEKDERHLFPELHRLIAERQPEFVFGEQVGSKAGIAWLDNVQLSLENSGYTCGAVTFPACSVGSPHQRQRIYWVAESTLVYTEIAGGGRDSRTMGSPETETICENDGGELDSSSEDGGLADNQSNRPQEQCEAGREEIRTAGDGKVGGLSDNQSERRGEEGSSVPRPKKRLTGNSAVITPAPTNGLWRNADWLYCRDGKWRPVEPGLKPLVDVFAERVGRMLPRLEAMGIDTDTAKRILKRRGTTLAAAGRNRVTRLKGYGNAIVMEQAVIFIKTFMEIL